MKSRGSQIDVFGEKNRLQVPITASAESFSGCLCVQDRAGNPNKAEFLVRLLVHQEETTKTTALPRHRQPQVGAEDGMSV